MKNLMEKILNQVTDHKAEADLILSTSKSLKLSAQSEAISEYKVSSSQILGIRLIKENKVGISYTESLDEDSLKLMVSQALENAETNEVNQNEKILDLTGDIEDVMTYAEEAVDISEKTKRVINLETEVKKRDKRTEAVPYNGYAENAYTSHYMSSRGRYGIYQDQSYQAWTSALLGEGSKKSMYYDFTLSHTFKDLDWEKVIKESLYHAQQMLLEKTIPTGKYQVRFTEDSFKDLMEVFSGLYSAKAAMDKVNPWAEKLGEVVTSSDLTIEDHPLFERSFRINKFDSEGVQRKPLKLVENGVLQSLYHNSITANHFKTKSTAHASRGPQSSLNVGGTVLLIHGKNVKPMPQRYLEIIQLDGLHAGTNRITGDFSLPVKGYVCENGERLMSFGGVTLSGNFFNMLKNVEVTGSELLASSDNSFFSVPLIFNELSIAGAAV